MGLGDVEEVGAEDDDAGKGGEDEDSVDGGSA